MAIPISCSSPQKKTITQVITHNNYYIDYQNRTAYAVDVSGPIGTLIYDQSFCIYNKHFCSTDGKNIAIQDINLKGCVNYAANVGHGNSFQIGGEKYGYISGWDDNKIYVVDMSLVQIHHVINLPTKGYTTGVVDEENNKAYVFQRDTFPDDKDFYNFLTIDLESLTVISSIKLDFDFAAMQSCDLLEDRIVVLAGLGTIEAPSRMIVFNTSGSLIGEYFLDIIENKEPEGVFLDKNNRLIYISTFDRFVYRLTFDIVIDTAIEA